jgi:nucleotide-binding universal stress UspA family protein
MMRHTSPPSPSVVVGIDGSRSAITAALWAVDEAVERDIPLRLVYALESDGAAERDPHATARRLATADIAVREAIVAVESTEAPVKIEVEILHGRPAQVLLEASSSAAMVCVGALGLRHALGAGVGSTAAALATVAHCPVAVVRGCHASLTRPGVIVAEIDESPSSRTVLERAVAEAQLRRAPLRVLSTWQPRYTDIHDSHAVAEGNRDVRAQLGRRMEWFTRTYPHLDIRPVATHGTTLNYLARHAESIQLVVVGRRRSPGLADVVGPLSHSSLHDTDCSVLVCEPRAAL